MAANNTTASQDRTFDQDQIVHIRRALLIGLASYGELERVINWADTQKELGCETDLKPLHPTGSAETVLVFAEALTYVS